MQQGKQSENYFVKQDKSDFSLFLFLPLSPVQAKKDKQVFFQVINLLINASINALLIG
jgi:hypothetical protein